MVIVIIVSSLIIALLQFFIVKLVLNRCQKSQRIAERLTLELQNSELRFKNIFLGHSSIMLLIDPDDGKIIFASHAASEFFGYPVSSLCTMSTGDLKMMPPRLIAKELGKIDQKNNFFILEHEMETGEKRVVEIHNTLIDYLDRKILSSVIYDITKLRRAEESLGKEEKNAQLLNNLSTEMSVSMDIENIYKLIVSVLGKRFPDTIILYVSVDEENKHVHLEALTGLKSILLNQILKVTGFNPVGKSFRLPSSHYDYLRSGKLIEFQGGLAEFASSELPELAAITIEKMIDMHKIYTIGMNKDGRLMAALHFLTFGDAEINENRFIETTIMMAAINIQKQLAVNALKESEAKYKIIIEGSPNPVFSITNDCVFKDVNSAFTSVAGKLKDEI
jgi:PAS domain S-box-containing protein